MKLLKFVSIFSILTLTVVFNNCATPGMASKISKSSRPDANKSYIFGSFYQKSVYKSDIGLVLEELGSGKKLHIEFSRDYFLFFGSDPVFAIEVNPGMYRISGLFNTETRLSYRYLGVYPPENLKHFLDTFEVRKGNAVYIGDYTGYSRKKIYHIQWGLYEIADNFIVTSQKLRKKYGEWGMYPLVHAFKKE